MSEIEKMYKLANVQAQYKKRIECKEGHSIGQPCEKCPCIDCDKSVFKDVMPPFTAEKQLELIKFLLKNYEGVDMSKQINRFYFLVDNATFSGCRHDSKSFEEGLAGVINKLWIDMSEEEKQQVKGILE